MKLIGTRSDVDKLFAIGSIKEVKTPCLWHLGLNFLHIYRGALMLMYCLTTGFLGVHTLVHQPLQEADCFAVFFR